MHDFRLALDVPVAWLIDLSRSNFCTDVLPAGAVLDRAPVPVTSEVDTPRQMFAIRVHGLEGFVSGSRLKEALPDWDPQQQMPSEERRKPEANELSQLHEERERVDEAMAALEGLLVARKQKHSERERLDEAIAALERLRENRRKR